MSEAVPFSDLVAQRAFLQNLARALVHDEHAAEDIAQDALLEALEARPTALRSPRAWLSRVARRGAWRWKQREAERPMRERRAARPESVEDRSERDLALQHDVLEAVRALEPIHRSVIFLRFYEDRSPSRIAEELGVPVSTVKTRLQRGLARLRDELDRKHGGQRGAWLVPLALVAAPSGIGVQTSVAPVVASALMLVMKKLAIATSVLLALGLGFWVVRERPFEDAVEPLHGAGLTSEELAEDARRRVTRVAAAAEPEPRASGVHPLQQPVPTSDPAQERGVYRAHLVLAVLSDDPWLNPTQREFTAAEQSRIVEFAKTNGAAADSLDRAFYRGANDLGARFLAEGRYDGSVDERTLSEDEREELPWQTHDWMNPIFVEFKGRQRTWVQLDLRTEFPELARLREEGWNEMTAARNRLRDFIQALPKN